MKTVTLNGQPVDMDACANLMDDELRETLHFAGFDSDQDFLDAYVAAHAEKYDGEVFTI